MAPPPFPKWDELQASCLPWLSSVCSQAQKERMGGRRQCLFNWYCPKMAQWILKSGSLVGTFMHLDIFALAHICEAKSVCHTTHYLKHNDQIRSFQTFLPLKHFPFLIENNSILLSSYFVDP